jgi:predicted adenylyl cyclase CyaB
MAGVAVARNVELKARDRDPRRSEQVCVELGAADEGVLRQRDTYFAAPLGYLKVREDAAGGAELIVYERPREPDARESRYRRLAVPPELRELLGAALGEGVVVEKRRRLFLWRGVRIHLDRVEGLGSFLELEAVAPPGSDLAAEREAVAELRSRLGIRDTDLVAGSYADLLLARPPLRQASTGP